jgi:hypothetical protein
MSKPTYTYHRYNEIGELLFFVDYYDDKTSPPFEHLFEGHPAYFISFISPDYYNYFDEMIEYFLQKHCHEEELDVQTFGMIINAAFDKLQNSISPELIEVIPKGYLKGDLIIFRRDKAKIDVYMMELSDEPMLFSDWSELVRITLNYYKSYGEKKFNRVFPLAIRRVENQQFIAAVRNLNFNDELLDSLNSNVFYWELKLEKVNVYFIINETGELIAQTSHFNNLIN